MTQPESVKALAKDSDTIVSLYTNHLLRSQEGIPSYYDPKEAEETLKQSAPVSGEHFKNELKTLAQGLDEFSPKEVRQPVTQTASHFQPELDQFHNQRRNLSESRAGARTAQPPIQQPQFVPQTPNSPQPPVQPRVQASSHQVAPQPSLPPHVQRQRLEETPSTPGYLSSVSGSNGAQGSQTLGLAALLDPNSQLKVAHVREGLNLSSDNEALRMLISLGFDRLKKILPVD